jgi:antitoxin VapB
MALSIKNDQADRLARELAARTGESLTDVVVNALAERLARETARGRRLRRVSEELGAIRERCSQLPRLGASPGEDLVRYDERGLPT